MTRMEAMAAVAQGVINISEGITTVERDSRVYRGMEEVCRREALDVERLHQIKSRLEGGLATAPKVLALVTEMLNERTDPEFGA